MVHHIRHTGNDIFTILYIPSLSSPKFPQPIFLPTRKFGPTISTLELADDDNPCRPATAECIALDPVDFPPRLSSLPFCSFSLSLFCMALVRVSSSEKNWPILAHCTKKFILILLTFTRCDPRQ